MKFRFWRTVALGLFLSLLVPFIFMVPSPGTPADQVKLDRIVKQIEWLAIRADNDQLKNILHYTVYKYSKIGRTGVSLQPLPWDVAGMNAPQCPGLTIDEEVWDTYNEEILLMILVHEAGHDYFPYLGHQHLSGIVWGFGPEDETSELEKLLRRYPWRFQK